MRHKKKWLKVLMFQYLTQETNTSSRFIEQHEEPPKEIVLDFDGADIPVHGDQPGRFFSGYYDHHCYFPLYVFCGRHLLVSYLRTSNV